MKKLILLAALFALCGCSFDHPTTWRHKAYIIELEHCFGRIDSEYKPKLLSFLAGNGDEDFFVTSNIIIARRTINGGAAFMVGGDRKYITHWMSACEGLRELWINIDSLELK